MPGPLYPKFRRDVSGALLLTDSEQGRTVGKNRETWCPPCTTQQVEKDARERVLARQGDINNQKDVLGEYVMQFGKYRGQNFRWAMENVPGYVGWIIGEIIKDEGKEDKSSKHQQNNKASLKNYVMMFREGREMVSAKTKEQPGRKQQPIAWKSLLVGPQLSPIQLQKRIKRMLSPPKFTPNIPSRKDKDLDDEELLACVEEIESGTQVLKESSVSTGAVKSKAKRSLFQPKETTFAPSPSLKKRATSQTSLAPSQTAPSQTSLAPSQTAPSHTAPSHTTLAPAVLPLQNVLKNMYSYSLCQTYRLLLQNLHYQLQQTQVVIHMNKSYKEPLLYEGWKTTLPDVDHQWVSNAFFRLNAKNKIEFKMEKVTQLWFHPPQPSLHTSGRIRKDRYFTHRLFLWMPVNLWGVIFHCPHKDSETSITCNGILTRAGMHQKTRLVLDEHSFYVMASEYLACSKCGKKLVAWTHSIVSQLDQDKQLMFPCILTLKLACDKVIVVKMRDRGLGNSSSSMKKQLEETHSEHYLTNVHHYLKACDTYIKAGTVGLVSSTSFEEPPVRRQVPGHRWLMKIYQLDVLQRLDFIKASMTSLFGTVLKIDSTKKITKKLAGRSAKTSMWATNVGNEHGQVIMTVMTTSEGHGLVSMIQGVCRRYIDAGVPPPRILYVDRDCCGAAQVGKYFSNWPFLLVRLDIWHFMRRLSVGCTTDAHPLYGSFMSGLSHCIFKWEEEDVKLLKIAKKAEMIQQHIPDPSDADVVRHIKSAEMSLHCRRMTRGTRETTTLLTQLIQSLDGDHGLDTQGVPLINSLQMQRIWAQQSHHVACLQDPEGVQLYTVVGTIKKGGVELPKYRCARGSTSLECFHLHMNRFIPGTLASDVNFQVYLLDGVHRWNEDRHKDATAAQTTQSHLSYNGALRDSVNKLSSRVLGRKMCRDFTAPGKYTGELIGLEYLYSQSTGASVEYNEAVHSIEEDAQPDEEHTGDDDEGFEDLLPFQDLTIPPLEPETPQRSTVPSRPLLRYPTDEEYRQMMDDQVGTNSIRPPSHSQSGQSQEPTTVTVQRQQPSTASSGQEQSEHHTKETPVSTTGVQYEPQVEMSPATANPGATSCDDSNIGPDNIPGYKHVTDLASFLCSLHEQTDSLSTAQANEVIRLWDALSDYDKSRTKFPQRFSSSGSGRFRSPKKLVALGVTSIERAVLGPNPTRANWPSCNRYVEATVEQLVKVYPCDKRTKGKHPVSRWIRIKDAYGRVQNLIVNNMRVMENTEIQLPSLNKTTITQCC